MNHRPPNDPLHMFVEGNRAATDAARPTATSQQLDNLRTVPSATWTEVAPGIQLIHFGGAVSQVTTNSYGVVGLPFPGQWRVRRTPFPQLARTRDGDLLPETLAGLPRGTVIKANVDLVMLAWKLDDRVWTVTGSNQPHQSTELLSLATDWQLVTTIPF